MPYFSGSERREHAIVTGGVRGIGKAISERLMELEYFVHIVYKKNELEASHITEQHKGRCLAHRIDGADSAAVAEFVADCCKRYDMTTLVNNIGITRDALVHDLNWNEFRQIFDVNVGSVFNFTRAVLPSMQANRYGNIINISSVSSRMSRPGNALYGASKAAIERFSQSVAYEYARYDIATNIVVPRLVLTDMNRGYIDENRSKIINRTPSRQLTTAHEVSDAVAMLLARKPVLHGAIIHVTGGSHIPTD